MSELRAEYITPRDIEGNPARPWKPRRVSARLEQSPGGDWYIILGSGSPILATDAEVSLWLELQEARAALRKVKE